MNPLKKKGMPLEKQLRPWSELNVKPYDKNSIHPYTRARIILMNGIEVEGAIFSHQFARNLADPELKKQIAYTRRVEQQQQKVINWLSPADESTVETTIGYEQLAVDMTAFMSANLTDPYVKQVFDFGLLEDFDHLYRFSNLLQMTQGVKSEKMLGGFTEVLPGRPTILEHRHAFDDVRKPSSRRKADPLTKLFILTLTAGEQQTMNFYMNLGNTVPDRAGRGLYQEIAMIEEQHVTQYESLMDPKAPWLENALLHEYNECWLYWSFAEQEEDADMRAIWERHLDMELGHLHALADIARREGVDIEAVLPESFPEPLQLESQVDYVRQVLEAQLDYNACETEVGPPDSLPKNPRYGMVQKTLNGAGAPSEEVIALAMKKSGRDYRFEIAGERPDVRKAANY